MMIIIIIIIIERRKRRRRRRRRINEEEEEKKEKKIIQETMKMKMKMGIYLRWHSLPLSRVCAQLFFLVNDLVHFIYMYI